MKYLVDTCVISELIKPQPQQQVVDALRNIDNHRLYLSVLTVGELDKGIARLPHSPKKRRLWSWLNDVLLEEFGDRILAFDSRCARMWGQILATAQSRGDNLPVVNAMIAASAQVHDLIVATRNETDLVRCGAQTWNPYEKD